MDSRPLACDAHIHVFLTCAGRCDSRCGLLYLINTRHAHRPHDRPRSRGQTADRRPAVEDTRTGRRRTPGTARLLVCTRGGELWLVPPWPGGPGSLCSATTPASNRVSASATLAGELGQATTFRANTASAIRAHRHNHRSERSIDPYTDRPASVGRREVHAPPPGRAFTA